MDLHFKYWTALGRQGILLCVKRTEAFCLGVLAPKHRVGLTGDSASLACNNIVHLLLSELTSAEDTAFLWKESFSVVDEQLIAGRCNTDSVY